MHSNQVAASDLKLNPNSRPDMIKDVTIKNSQILSDNWCILKKYTYSYVRKDGTRQEQTREVYDRGNGSAILLYDSVRGTIVLTRQFRLPTFVNGNTDGMMIEACAGLLDEDNPEDCIRREAEEETGYRIDKVVKIFEAYMSPGSVTEILHFFIAAYNTSMKVAEGGGVAHEEENIEVLELPFEQALGMIATGEIRDAKTIMLLQYVRLNGIL